MSETQIEELIFGSIILLVSAVLKNITGMFVSKLILTQAYEQKQKRANQMAKEN